MLSKDIFDDFIKTKESIIINLFKIYNNNNILIQCKLNLTYIDDLITLTPSIYLCKEYVCLYCSYFEDNNNHICKCDINLHPFYIYYKPIQIKISQNEDIFITINDIIDNTICHKLIKIINTIKYCDTCNDIINSQNNLCNDCKWQKIYNIKYSTKLENTYSICQEDLYISDSITICGNKSHSIYSKCKKNIKICPICRQK